MAAHQKPRVAVVGAGLTGLSLALALSRRSMRVRVYEQSAGLIDDGSAVFFNSATIKTLRSYNADVLDAFEEVATTSPASGSSLRYYDGADADDDFLFEINQPLGSANVSSCALLTALSNRLPEPCLEFGKQAVEIRGLQSEDPLEVVFRDGTRAQADAVVCCDGIHSKLRVLCGSAHQPSVAPQYAEQYVYDFCTRRDDIAEILSVPRMEENSLYLAKGKILSFTPDTRRRIVRSRLFCAGLEQKDRDEPGMVKSLSPEAVADELEGWTVPLHSLVMRCSGDAQRRSVYDFYDRLPGSLSSSRLCLAGSAAHAMVPHLGAGPSTSMQDVAILAELLADRRVSRARDVEAAFSAYDQVRRPQVQAVVQASRRAGTLLFQTAADVRDDLAECERQVKALQQRVVDFNVGIAIAEAKQELGPAARRQSMASPERRADILRQPYTEMLGMYDYYEQAFQSKR